MTSEDSELLVAMAPSMYHNVICIGASFFLGYAFLKICKPLHINSTED